MMKEVVRVASEKLLSLEAVLVGAVADLQGSRGPRQADIYNCMLERVVRLLGECPASQEMLCSSLFEPIM